MRSDREAVGWSITCMVPLTGKTPQTPWRYRSAANMEAASTLTEHS